MKPGWGAHRKSFERGRGPGYVAQGSKNFLQDNSPPIPPQTLFQFRVYPLCLIIGVGWLWLQSGNRTLSWNSWRTGAVCLTSRGRPWRWKTCRTRSSTVSLADGSLGRATKWTYLENRSTITESLSSLLRWEDQWHQNREHVLFIILWLTRSNICGHTISQLLLLPSMLITVILCLCIYSLCMHSTQVGQLRVYCPCYLAVHWIVCEQNSHCF